MLKLLLQISRYGIYLNVPFYLSYLLKNTIQACNNTEGVLGSQSHSTRLHLWWCQTGGIEMSHTCGKNFYCKSCGGRSSGTNQTAAIRSVAALGLAVASNQARSETCAFHCEFKAVKKRAYLSR